jgi:hypothetical protein
MNGGIETMRNATSIMRELPYSLGTDVYKNVIVRDMPGEDSFSFVRAKKITMSEPIAQSLDNKGIDKKKYVMDRIESSLKIIDLWRVAFDHHMMWDRDANNRSFVHKYHHCWGTPIQCFWTMSAITVEILEDKTIFHNNLFYVEHALPNEMVYINVYDQALPTPPFSNVQTKSIWQQVIHYDDLDAAKVIQKYESFLATPVKRVNDPVHPLEMYPDEKEYKPMEKYLDLLEDSLWYIDGDVKIIYDFDKADDGVIRITIEIGGKIAYDNEFNFQNVNKDTIRQICEALNISLCE